MDLKLTSPVLAALVLFAACCPHPIHAASPDNPCTFVTSAQVSAALGVTMADAKREAPTLCQWQPANSPNPLTTKRAAVVLVAARAYAFAKAPIAHGFTSTPASGVCDEAIYSIAHDSSGSTTAALYAKKASVYFVVHVYGVADQSKAMDMEKTLAVEACAAM